MLECDALEKQLCDVNQKRREQRVKFMVLAVASVCVFLLIWQLIVISGVVNVRNLPSPAQIFKAFINHTPDMLHTVNPRGDFFLCPRRKFCCNYYILTFCKIL